MSWISNFNLGTKANDGTGDGIRTTFGKIINNLNFLKGKVEEAKIEDLTNKVNSNTQLIDEINTGIEAHFQNIFQAISDIRRDLDALMNNGFYN